MASPIDGRAIALQIRTELAAQINLLQVKGVKPSLAVLQVGDRPDSSTYIRMKRNAAQKIGMEFKLIQLPDTTTQVDIIRAVEEVNADDSIHGLIVQLPLPDHVDEATVNRAVSVEKDVDGFHVFNIGSLALRGQKPRFISCTPKGCIELLSRSGIEIAGKDAVVLGRSNIVGIPIAHLLLEKNATVTICHSRTADIPEKCRRADILVVAIGKPEFVKGSWIKEGAVVIDVGINSIPDETKKSGYRLVGDIEYSSACHVASRITPVPGGVGPMTVAMLLQNTVKSAALTSLIAACAKGDLESVIYFVNTVGFKVSDLDSAGENAICSACSGGFVEIAKFLVSKGASISIPEGKHF